jgi:hypothetical protein
MCVFYTLENILSSEGAMLSMSIALYPYVWTGLGELRYSKEER